MHSIRPNRFAQLTMWMLILLSITCSSAILLEPADEQHYQAKYMASQRRDTGSNYSSISFTNDNRSTIKRADDIRHQSIYLGVWQPGMPADFSGLNQFEHDAGRSVAIVHWYQDWSTEAELNLGAIEKVAQRQSISMITWEPWDYTKGLNQPAYQLDHITAGEFDSYIRSWARGLAHYGQPVLLRFAHEMNGWWAPWCVGQQGNTAEDYIAAWRHIHDIFRQEGATNVQWVWSPNIIVDGEAAFEAMFPGDAYVDWIALDGYNNPTFGQWLSFEQLFGESYERLTQLSVKPIMIAEMASAEDGDPTHKARWITEAFTEAIPARSRIKAVVWFNQNKEADWRINSSTQAQQAFQEAVRASYYQSCYYCIPLNQFLPLILK